MHDALALLDRELLLSAIAHDMRGALTAVQGWVELSEDPGAAAVEPAVERLHVLVRAIGEPTGTARVESVLTSDGADVPVLARAPLALLRAALAGLPHDGSEIVAGEGVLCIHLRGVPEVEACGGWSLEQARAWRDAATPGHSGARLRMALRLIGAVGHAYVPDDGARTAAGTFTLRLRRA
jgi:hypothetical protein